MISEQSIQTYVNDKLLKNPVNRFQDSDSL